MREPCVRQFGYVAEAAWVPVVNSEGSTQKNARKVHLKYGYVAVHVIQMRNLTVWHGVGYS